MNFKMKRVTLFFITAALLFAALALPGLAASGALVTDEAGLLTEDELRGLNEQAQAVSDQCGCDVAILIVQSMGGQTRENFTEDAYVRYGIAEDGVLLMVSIEARDYYTLAHGEGDAIFSDYEKGQLEDAFVPALSQGNYAEAFSDFISAAKDILASPEESAPVSPTVESNGRSMSFRGGWLFVLLFSVGPALIFCGVQLSKMKSAKPARNASNYIPEGGLRITHREDLYLYRTVTRRRIQQTNASNSSRSGGSSGRSGGSSGGGFTGRGGKF